MVKILDSISGLRLSDFQHNSIDAFGDASEFLMILYAGDVGKSGDKFFSPQQVSELLAEITGVGQSL